MRIITIRHDKSMNNLLLEQSVELYEEKRSNDPDIATGGEERCRNVGRFLREKGIKIDKFYCSLHLRALKTMNYIAEEYNPEVPREYFPEIHEKGGIFLGNKGYPGLGLKEVKEKFPKVIIPDEEAIKDGWYKNEHRENDADFKERVKKAIAKIKELSANCDDDYTICCISHETFLNAFYSLLGSKDFQSEYLNFGHSNLALSSFTIDKKKNVTIDFINFPTN